MIQDERNNVSDLILKPGTFVMLKNEGLINKLARQNSTDHSE